jgi:glutathione S-transferase
MIHDLQFPPPNPGSPQLMQYRLRGIEPNLEVVDFAIKRLSDKLDIYDKILAKQKYMGGDEFSLIDIFYMPYTSKLFEAGDGALIETRPNVRAWWERVAARASWKNEIDPEGAKSWSAMVASLG